MTVAWTGTGAAAVTWTDRSTNETGFDVEHSEPSGWVQVLDLRDHRTGQPAQTGQTYTRTFTGLDQSKTQCYRVVAFNDAGRGVSQPEAGVCVAARP